MVDLDSIGLDWDLYGNLKKNVAVRAGWRATGLSIKVSQHMHFIHTYAYLRTE